MIEEEEEEEHQHEDMMMVVLVRVGKKEWGGNESVIGLMFLSNEKENDCEKVWMCIVDRMGVNLSPHEGLEDSHTKVRRQHEN